MPDRPTRDWTVMRSQPPARSLQTCGGRPVVNLQVWRPELPAR